MFTGSLTGDFLPPSSYIKVQYNNVFHYSLPYRMTRHFSNESTMIAYTEKIYLRYVNGKREELKLQPDYPVLVISLVKGQEVF